MSRGKRVEEKSNHSRKTEEKKNFSKIIFTLFAVAYAIITLIFYVTVIKTNLLPISYVAIFAAVEVVLTMLLIVGLVKNHKKIILNIICLILVIVISTGYIFGMRYIGVTMNFLGNVFTEVEETEEYYVVVRKDSGYNTIEELDGKDIYTFQAEEDVKEEIESKINSKLRDGNGLVDIGNSLLSEKIEAITVSDSQFNMISEEIENFENSVKIIYRATHKIEKAADIQDENSNYTINNGVFNLYISGIDISGNIGKVSRSDANIIATVNTNTHQVLLTSIPRDYYVTLHSKQAIDKLTHSGIYGINETVTTVEDLLDIDINYYVRVNFTTVIKLVDTLGGVDVYSDYDFSAGGYSFKKGYNHLNGQQALMFSRERHSFSGGDNQRVLNQQHVIDAVMKKTLNSRTMLTKYTDILSSLEGCFQTNVKQEEMNNLVKDQLRTMSNWTTKSNALSGKGASKPTYSMGSRKLYVMIPDKDSVEEAKRQIKEAMGE